MRLKISLMTVTKLEISAKTTKVKQIKTEKNFKSCSMKQYLTHQFTLFIHTAYIIF